MIPTDNPSFQYQAFSYKNKCCGGTKCVSRRRPHHSRSPPLTVQRFTEVIEYFDARMIGLTATPTNFIDRDTFRLFGCAFQCADFPWSPRKRSGEIDLRAEVRLDSC